MNPFEKRKQNRIRFHPETWRSLLTIPTPETIETLIKYNLLDSGVHLAPWIFSLIPLWEQLACAGNEHLAKLITELESRRLSLIKEEDESLRSNLQRIRLLASTPGTFPFSPIYIQEHLSLYLESADTLADLPGLEVVSFSREELVPLANELGSYRIQPLSRRYVQNLFHITRQEAVLTALAYIAKNYPLLSTCRQAYALMLSLDLSDNWSNNPFCLRLLANRFWEYRLAQDPLLI